MKKLFIFMFLLVMNVIFSEENKIKGNNCDFINPRDNVMEEIVDKIKKEKKENDFFCDIDGLKSIYYLIDDGKYQLNMGVKLLVDGKTTYRQLNEMFEEKLFNYIELTTYLKDKDRNKDFLNDISKINVRFYVMNDRDQILYYIGRYVENRDDNVVKFIGYGKGEKKLEEMGILRNIKVDFSKDETIIF